MRKLTPLCVALAAALLAATAWLNFIHLSEAYGSGPPYYGRTTNMDKWSDPLPMLALIDAAALLLSSALLAFGLRKGLLRRTAG